MWRYGISLTAAKSSVHSFSLTRLSSPFMVFKNMYNSIGWTVNKAVHCFNSYTGGTAGQVTEKFHISPTQFQWEANWPISLELNLLTTWNQNPPAGFQGQGRNAVNVTALHLRLQESLQKSARLFSKTSQILTRSSVTSGCGGASMWVMVWRISWMWLLRWRTGLAMTVLVGAMLADSKGSVVGRGRGDCSCFTVISYRKRENNVD